MSDDRRDHVDYGLVLAFDSRPTMGQCPACLYRHRLCRNGAMRKHPILYSLDICPGVGQQSLQGNARKPNLLENADRWFWPRVDRRDDGSCWEWLAGRLKNGYGRVSMRRRGALAHRIAFTLAKGEPVNNVLHHCDNPPCCNPSHLYDGTQQENVDDRDRRNRHRAFKGEQCVASRLTLVQVEEIRAADATQRVLSARYGVSQATISRVRTGATWKP